MGGAAAAGGPVDSVVGGQSFHGRRGPVRSSPARPSRRLMATSPPPTLNSDVIISVRAVDSQSTSGTMTLVLETQCRQRTGFRPLGERRTPEPTRRRPIRRSGCVPKRCVRKSHLRTSNRDDHRHHADPTRVAESSRGSDPLNRFRGQALLRRPEAARTRTGEAPGRDPSR